MRSNIEILTPIGEDWFVNNFAGHELLSASFDFNISVTADTANLNPEELLRKNLTIRLSHNDASRIFNGIILSCETDEKVLNIKLVPWYWFLKYDICCRIFQDQTVIQIFNTICSERGFNDFDFRLAKTYEPIPYCLQYHESTFDFINRILAHAGIYYYFTHEKGKHIMVLADYSMGANQFGAVKYSNSNFIELHIHEWLEQNNLYKKQYIGQGNYPGFSPGLNFELTEHKYFLLAVEHLASDNTYINKFTCILSTQEYHPEISANPYVPGVQRAIVTDNNLNRVKVKFNWDQDTNHSACWIKVSQQLAGYKWGFQFIPRVGSEVIVNFFNRDPDIPVIIGSLYNVTHLPPYQYPNEQNKTGIKTNSNEIQFNDAKDAEELSIYAGKDYENTIQQSMAVNILENNNEKIIGNRTVYTQKEHTIIVDKQICLTAGKGLITITPDNIKLEAPKITLG